MDCLTGARGQPCGWGVPWARMPPLLFSPSLNRAVLADLPGLPAGMAGTQAHEWLASWSVARLVRERLPPFLEGSDAASPRALSGLVERGNLDALALADDLGAALAALLATLHLAPGEARAARTEWPASHWDRWGRVRRVGVGGGMVRGALGERMVRTAQAWLPDLGAGGVAVFRAGRSHLLPLLGAARQLPDGPAVLLDAGHTSVKRASGVVREGIVVSLTEAPALPAPLNLTPTDLLVFLVEAVADLSPSKSFSLGVSLATYMDEQGQPYSNQGGLYGPLGALPLVPTLERKVRKRLDSLTALSVSHDGTAALQALSGGADAAVVLGTSLGVGLRPAEHL